MVRKQSPLAQARGGLFRRMSWQISGLIVWVGLIGAANVSLPRYLDSGQRSVVSGQVFLTARRRLTTDHCPKG
jgi:hypothetical protein